MDKSTLELWLSLGVLPPLGGVLPVNKKTLELWLSLGVLPPLGGVA